MSDLLATPKYISFFHCFKLSKVNTLSAKLKESVMSLFAFHLHFPEERGHRIALEAADTASHLEAGRIEVLVADILVAVGGVVLPSHAPQPLLQSDGIVEGKPATKHSHGTA